MKFEYKSEALPDNQNELQNALIFSGADGWKLHTFAYHAGFWRLVWEREIGYASTVTAEFEDKAGKK